MATPQMNPAARNEEERRWQSVLDRDAREDGHFVYAVETTGVYCRPTCPSRRPLRKNVAFFENPDEARAAGFHPCRRCRPEAGGTWDAAREKVLAACRYIEAQQDRIPTLEELGKRVGQSPGHFQRVFKRVVGISPRKYADALRVERLKRRLQQGEPIAGALYDTGYGSTSRLYETAASQLGMTPRSYRRKASGEQIQYVTLACPVGGQLLVAATGRGLCAVRLGDTARELVAELEEEFQGAVFERGGETLGELLEALVGYLAGERSLPDLPFDVQATAFQRRVWEAIRAIPEGATATYGDLAQAIGSPNAVRAVAQACARNPVALVIPCHRVAPKSGGTGGYRWGENRKEKLLRLEKQRA
ncbi:MAG: bifunctional DNA-binding transcriptional regulator/O6-methylguanine-DNA methyltransferase Ada [Myxococcales bacterium]|nr:bifunctional DNA-binding transcriptional regulator/O6-methylguanine-DNA methyltransferase Ada [Myxococcales bacterium]